MYVNIMYRCPIIHYKCEPVADEKKIISFFNLGSITLNSNVESPYSRNEINFLVVMEDRLS